MNNEPFRVTDDLLAGKGQRLLHHFIDLVPQYAVMYAIAYGFFYIGEFTGNYALDDYWNGMSDLEDYAFSYLLMVLYYYLMERYTFKTLGKYATNTIVVSIDGTEPTSKQILQRSFSRIIPFDALSFLGRNGKGWHDSIAKTYVVKADKFHEKKMEIYELEQIGQIGDGI